MTEPQIIDFEEACAKEIVEAKIQHAYNDVIEHLGEDIDIAWNGVYMDEVSQEARDQLLLVYMFKALPRSERAKLREAKANKG